MLDRNSPREPTLLNRADEIAVLHALADMLPIEGVIVDNNGKSYHPDTQCDYDRSGSHQRLRAEVLPIRSNKALVKLRRTHCAKHAARANGPTYLFVLAKSDGEWEMMGQPAPFGHSSIPA